MNQQKLKQTAGRALGWLVLLAFLVISSNKIKGCKEEASIAENTNSGKGWIDKNVEDFNRGRATGRTESGRDVIPPAPVLEKVVGTYTLSTSPTPFIHLPGELTCRTEITPETIWPYVMAFYTTAQDWEGDVWKGTFTYSKIHSAPMTRKLVGVRAVQYKLTVRSSEPVYAEIICTPKERSAP